jgi:N-acetylglucosamine-6-phosphate deacetylase
MQVVARDYRDARWLDLELDGERIKAARAGDKPGLPGPDDDWVAPAFWDIQVNGRWGHSFSSPSLTVEQVAGIVRAQTALGTARLCPTLITAPVDHLLHGVRTIDLACARFPDVNARVLGIHLEGPFISERDGYRGAHPGAAIRDPDWHLFEDLQRASGGRIVVVTLAPERTGAIEFIRRATGEGVVIAIGHTAADGATIQAAAQAGATLSTHVGNGIAALLPRHPNPIWEQAALHEVFASIIADGHHVDRSTLRVLARAKGPERTILISDASPLAGLPAGTYGAWAVDPSGKIVVAGTPYLAGSNQGLDVGLQNLLIATGWPLEQVISTVTVNPARLLGHPAPRLVAGEVADFVIFRCPRPGTFVVKRVCTRGNWEPEANKTNAGPCLSSRPGRPDHP